MLNNSKEPIRVLHVIGAMNVGGAETMIMDLYRKINRKKVQFDFLVHTDERCAYDSEIESLGGRIFRMTRLRGYNSFSYYRKCLSFFRQHPEISVVHGHIGSSASIYLYAAKKTRKYTIAHSHSAVGITNLHDFFYKIFAFPTRYIADSLFGCSTEAGIARYGKRMITKKKYMNFHNAIEVQDYFYNSQTRRMIRDEFGLKEEEIVIGTVGRMTKAKNPRFIIRVFDGIVQKGGKCLWIGTGELFDECKGMVHDKNLSQSVIMTGRRSDVPAILQAFDGFILPSLWEGLPMVAIEAQAAGLPCLISESVSHETAITDLVRWKSISDSPQDWSNEILSMAKEHKNDRSSPIDQIRKAGYDIEDTAKWLSDFYIQNANNSQVR